MKERLPSVAAIVSMLCLRQMQIKLHEAMTWNRSFIEMPLCIGWNPKEFARFASDGNATWRTCWHCKWCFNFELSSHEQESMTETEARIDSTLYWQAAWAIVSSAIPVLGDPTFRERCRWPKYLVSNFAFAMNFFEESSLCTVLALQVLYLELRRGTPPEGMARLQDARCSWGYQMWCVHSVQCVLNVWGASSDDGHKDGVWSKVWYPFGSTSMSALCFWFVSLDSDSRQDKLPELYVLPSFPKVRRSELWTLRTLRIPEPKTVVLSMQSSSPGDRLWAVHVWQVGSLKCNLRVEWVRTKELDFRKLYDAQEPTCLGKWRGLKAFNPAWEMSNTLYGLLVAVCITCVCLFAVTCCHCCIPFCTKPSALRKCILLAMQRATSIASCEHSWISSAPWEGNRETLATVPRHSMEKHLRRMKSLGCTATGMILEGAKGNGKISKTLEIKFQFHATVSDWCLEAFSESIPVLQVWSECEVDAWGV